MAEIDAQLAEAGAPPADAVVTCVGGGGLLMGILEGLGDRRDVKVVAAETAGAASFAATPRRWQSSAGGSTASTSRPSPRARACVPTTARRI